MHSVVSFHSTAMTRPKSNFSKGQEHVTPKKSFPFTKGDASAPSSSSPSSIGSSAKGKASSVKDTVRQVFKSVGNISPARRREPQISSPIISAETYEACKSKYKLIPLENAAGDENITKREEDFERRDREMAERRMKARTRKRHPIIGLPLGRPESEDLKIFRRLWS